MRLIRLKPGHGEVLLVEGDPQVTEDEERLIEEFRRQLDAGMWAAVPTVDERSGRREAIMVADFDEVPRGAERIIFFPRAAGGRQPRLDVAPGGTSGETTLARLVSSGSAMVLAGDAGVAAGKEG